VPISVTDFASETEMGRRESAQATVY